MIIKTGRFGELRVEKSEEILIPNGLLGFPEDRRFCIVDPGDDTLILWLQSLDNPDVVFPILEPKVFRTDFKVTLSGADQRELGLTKLDTGSVFCVLTIPEDVTQMTANLKAPLVIHRDLQIAKQVVLQENEYSIKHLMFKELKAHLITIQSTMANVARASAEDKQPTSVPIQNLPVSRELRSLTS